MSKQEKNSRIHVLEYYPIGGNDSPHITELPRSTEPLPFHLKSDIIRYLRNGDFKHIGFMTHSQLINEFTGKPMNAFASGFYDDKYIWRDDLWIYFRDYDVKLPDDFIQHIQEFFAAGNNTHDALTRLDFSITASENQKSGIVNNIYFPFATEIVPRFE